MFFEEIYSTCCDRIFRITNWEHHKRPHFSKFVFPWQLLPSSKKQLRFIFIFFKMSPSSSDSWDTEILLLIETMLFNVETFIINEINFKAFSEGCLINSRKKFSFFLFFFFFKFSWLLKYWNFKEKTENMIKQEYWFFVAV